MEFGRISERKLNTINYKLPQDSPLNKGVLSGVRVASPKVYIGCSKWGRSEWVGKIFPRRTAERGFLENYAKNYNGIELDATHYKMYSTKSIGKWADKTYGNDFKYCPKMYQEVTHSGSLTGKRHIIEEFLAGVAVLREQLGPIFIQLGDNFSPHRKNELFHFLKSLPTHLQFFLEVRHEDWFKNVEIHAELFSFLTDHKIGAVITDTYTRRDCAHMQLTIPKVFIRFVAHSLHTSDYERIDEWVTRIKGWLNNGIEEIYFFMHLENEAYFPELSTYMIEKVNIDCDLDLKVPEFVKKKFSFF